MLKPVIAYFTKKKERAGGTRSRYLTATFYDVRGGRFAGLRVRPVAAISRGQFAPAIAGRAGEGEVHEKRDQRAPATA